TSTKVLIAEEQLLIAQALQKLLESEFEKVEIVETGRDVFSTAASFKPDVILLDSEYARSNGNPLVRYFQKLAGFSKVIVVTGHADGAYVVEAFRAGVSGYVLKRCTFSELSEAIRQVVNGKTYVTRLISPRAIAAAADPIPPKDAISLTPRQREVLQMVAEGYTAKEIANQLNLSVKTAVFHKMAIMDKLGLRTTAELTRYAIENGIVRAQSRPETHIELHAEATTALVATALS
ncbi:MAG TPA: response regulator transcription factor, partial [Bryobacteraceae bacterium]